MKKQGILLMLLLISIANLLTAQSIVAGQTLADETIIITGTVKTADGDALHLAFVQDKQYKNGAYTDSLGAFTLEVRPNSTLRVSCRGFRDTLFSVNNRPSLAIVLRPVVNIVASRSGIPPVVNPNDNINLITMRDELLLVEPVIPQKVELDRPTYAKVFEAGAMRTVVTGAEQVQGVTGGPDMAQGAIYPVFTHKEETQGSRYLFPEWVHGYVVNNKDSIVQNPDFMFNYDKMKGSLLLTRDKHQAVELFNYSLKSFTLFDALNQRFTFTLVPKIDTVHYVQVIASGAYYNIYKLIKTKFVAANYISDGVASSGNNFDSFEDEYTFYVLNVKAGELQKLPLKKKAIKEVFAAEPAKLNKFMADNSGTIDDSYLSGLGDYMNK